MAWIGRDRGRKHRLPSGLRNRLDAVAAQLPTGHVSRRDVTKYVVTGERARVLQELATVRAGSRRSHPADSETANLARLYALFAEADPALWVRWGRVLEAVDGNTRWTVPLASTGAIPAWLEHLLRSLAEVHEPRGYAPPASRRPASVEIAALVRVLEVENVRLDGLLDAVFAVESSNRYSAEPTCRLVAGMPGFADAVTARADRLSGRLTAGPVEQRTAFCSLVSGFPDDQLAVLAPFLAVAATAKSARVRDAATPLLRRVLASGSPTLRDLAVHGKPDARSRALDLLWRHGAEADRDFARQAAAADRTSRIRALLDTWDTGTKPAEAPLQLGVPEPAPIRWRVELTAELREGVEQTAEWHNRRIAQLNARRAQEMARYQARTGQPHPGQSKALPEHPHLAELLLQELGTDRPPLLARHSRDRQLGDSVVHLAGQPGLTAVAVVKTLARLGFLLDHANLLSRHAIHALEACHRREGQPDLMTLQRMLDEIGQPGRALVWKSITSAWHGLARGWDDEQVWPFVARNIDFVVARSRTADGDGSTDPSVFYRLVGSLPTQPPILVEHLYAVALGAARSHRSQAQHALRADPGRTSRAALALGDGRVEVRAAAATWLGRIADPACLPALEAAVAKEKQDVAKAAMLDALEALGRPMEAYLDRDKLLAQAHKDAAKGPPKSLDWLAWERLPPLHWADSGSPVPLPVVQHLVSQAVRLKSPQPNAMLRKHMGTFAAADREAFASALLESWISADLAPVSDAEAQHRAHQQATSMHRWMQQYPASFQGDPLLGRSVAELTAHYLPIHARTPAGSTISSKGVLAVVAAAGGRSVVAPTERYLKEWYGQRPGQGKALIGMLAWVQHPSATQLLLSIGSRFRTKSFQVEATRQIEALAEREGWTVAELADRTVPTAGFDADARLELSYGERTFTAQLLPDLSVELHDQDGAALKALPSPRRSDDAERVKAAKAALTVAKKELKSVVSLQQQRLYEALCTQRTWTAQDWQQFLAGHPVMRQLTRRLVWVAEPVGGPKTSFRLLDDGTLTDVDDEEVTLPKDGVVRLAHATNLERGEVEAWLAHLADYQVTPLFHQLGTGLYELPDELRSRHSLEEFRGHTLPAFALRNRALGLGWVRGPAEDAGWFHCYLKRFPTLGLVAELGFTGNALPEENRTVALLDLTFAREAPQAEAYGASPVALGDVPPALLSETSQDVRSIAAEGSGYDPDWERTCDG